MIYGIKRLIPFFKSLRYFLLGRTTSKEEKTTPKKADPRIRKKNVHIKIYRFLLKMYQSTD